MSMDDILSDILRLTRLKGCVYFYREFRAPWAMRIDQGPHAQFHVVARGSCIIQTAEAEITGAPGDVFVFPRGTAHVIADQPGRDAISGRDVITSIETGTPFFEQGEASTQLLCGHYEYRHDFHHPLFNELPDIIHLSANDFNTPETVDPIVPILLREMSAARPGVDVVVERLAEAMLIQVLRSYLLAQTSRTGFLAVLSDTRLSRAVKIIQDSAAHDIALEDIAREAGMSRSSLAEQFKSTLGCSPISYLTKWRMFTACDLLQDTYYSIGEVAQRVGYDSDIAFARAFKRELGASPTEYRRNTMQPTA